MGNGYWLLMLDNLNGECDIIDCNAGMMKFMDC